MVNLLCYEQSFDREHRFLPAGFEGIALGMISVKSSDVSSDSSRLTSDDQKKQDGHAPQNTPRRYVTFLSCSITTAAMAGIKGSHDISPNM